MKILVLGGGNSPEHEVSMRSAAAVAESARQLGHEVTQLNPHDEASQLAAALRDTDLVLPILHGAGGEDGSIQRVIEAAGRPYLGSGPAASEICFDKGSYKKLLQAHHLLTPAYELVDQATFERSPLRHQPFVLKPLDGGSSLDTYLIRNPKNIPPTIRDAFGRYPTMLLEELIEGVELTIGVLDQTALPVIEIIPPTGQEFDYDNKYNGATQELCPPQHVDAADQVAAQQLAGRIHQLTGCRHLSRTDMMLTPTHQLYVLETNTMPGLTDQSLYPKAAAADGIDWPHLVERFIELAQA